MIPQKNISDEKNIHIKYNTFDSDFTKKFGTCHIKGFKSVFRYKRKFHFYTSDFIKIKKSVSKDIFTKKNLHYCWSLPLKSIKLQFGKRLTKSRKM